MTGPNEYATDEQCWQALLERDTRADGSFIYAVVTTGIFCLPSCASRRPNRANVRIFADSREARRAGFRPCQRCRPESARANDLQTERITRACRFIGAAEEMPALGALAEAAGLSHGHFQRLFKKLVGLTPGQYAESLRQQRFRRRLTEQRPVTEALYAAGYGSSSRAYEAGGASLGMSPSSYRKGAEGIGIDYAVAPCTLGWVLVAATERGLCSIALADSPEALPGKLREEFPKASLAEAGAEFSATVAAVVSLIETPAAGHQLSLDIRGTAFQKRVWNALRQIPAGSTLSYSELAATIGSPGAARAVASACARNRLAVAIPCHRVVGSDGTLRGYRWGIRRKQALLQRETEKT
jgi:AraC family transcriptional regulator, regulatory protein of adaptative response / methylated-DNA-[protein]-cysteine methyltransferase